MTPDRDSGHGHWTDISDMTPDNVNCADDVVQWIEPNSDGGHNQTNITVTRSRRSGIGQSNSGLHLS